MVSVVITAYNVGPFIAQAIESVLGQTYKDIECVIVEDCSTDDTIAEIKRASIGDGRVRMVQNSENMGAGVSRRRGIEAANGDYILLLDGDDWIEPDFIEALYRRAVESGAEIVSGGIKVVHGDGAWEATSYGNCVAEGCEKVTKFWGERVVFMNNKLISRKLHQEVPYCQRRFIEDTPTIIPLLYLANKVAYIDNIGYNYRMQEGSLTHNASPFKYALFRALCAEDLISFFEKHDREYIKLIPLGLSYTRLIEQIKRLNPTKEMIEPYKDEWIEFTTAMIRRIGE